MLHMFNLYVSIDEKVITQNGPINLKKKEFFFEQRAWYSVHYLNEMLVNNVWSAN